MSKVYIVAEMSANHCQDYNRAVALVTAAKHAGADAVKLQTYTPDTMTIKSDKFVVTGGSPWDGETLYDLFWRAYMPWEWQPKLKKLADEVGIDLFSTAYDKTAVDFLEEIGVPFHKIGSFELTDIPLIEYAASKGKPLILSTGMASLAEVTEAVYAAADAGATKITLLKCVSAYPTPPSETNLRAITYLQTQFSFLRGVKVSVGLSDHTLGIAVPVAAVSLDITMIEKHITLSRSTPSPDSSFSLEPDEFKEMVDNVRIAEDALGLSAVRATKSEGSMRAFRRSLFVVEDIRIGDALTEKNVRSIRATGGLPPKHITEVLGRTATTDIERGTPLWWELIGGRR